MEKIIRFRIIYINTINAQAQINVLSTVITVRLANVTVVVRAQAFLFVYVLSTGASDFPITT